MEWNGLFYLAGLLVVSKQVLNGERDKRIHFWFCWSSPCISLFHGDKSRERGREERHSPEEVILWTQEPVEWRWQSRRWRSCRCVGKTEWLIQMWRGQDWRWSTGRSFGQSVSQWVVDTGYLPLLLSCLLVKWFLDSCFQADDAIFEVMRKKLMMTKK